MEDPIALVIFDCDGVLVDSERLAVRVEAELLSQLGWPLSEAEVFDRFGGRTQDAMFAEIAEQLGDAVPAAWRFRFERRCHETFEAELVPIDGILDALDRIACPSCIASSSSHEQLRFKLKLTGLYEQFRGRIFSATQVKNGKPAPDLFLHAAAQMGVSPAQCVVIEDSQYGVQAARRAGMRAFAFSGGLSSQEMLKGSNTTLFDHMRDLPGLIDQAAHKEANP